MARALAVLWCACLAAQGAEVVATLTMSARGAAVADIVVDGRVAAQQVVWAGADRYPYRVFLGPAAGKVHAALNAKHSAAGALIEVHDVRLERSEDPCHANAPVLFARPNTAGRHSDYPTLAYCTESAGALEFTVIFSNEDGGTSTRALMARWGRTTDIEYVYRIGKDGRGIIQAKGHNDVAFAGARDGAHPLLIVSTDNNMVAPAEGTPEPRFHVAPMRVDLQEHSREIVMDQHPATYRVMAEELEREGKLRPFGAVDGQKISDPRNYLFIEAKIANRDSRLAARVKLRGEDRWRASHLGRADYAIERDGWVRTTVELPPGTAPSQIARIGFECLIEPPGRDRPAPVAGECRLEAVSKVFLLDRAYRPGQSIWSSAPGARIPTGEMVVFAIPHGN
ncbi:MAG: hypothetical protein ACRD44_11105 [Bryobacteraceae bacterium]